MTGLVTNDNLTCKHTKRCGLLAHTDILFVEMEVNESLYETHEEESGEARQCLENKRTCKLMCSVSHTDRKFTEDANLNPVPCVLNA